MNKEKEVIREYSNGEITIVWRPAKCFHASFCWKELPEVFDPQKRPWTNPRGASSEQIVKQVKCCPSGALSYYKNKKEVKNIPVEKKITTEVHPLPNGPLLISGGFNYKNKDGKIIQQIDPTAFCRCGGSKNMPFCDGTHEKNNFRG
jgi:Uncharacterized conserved protein